jgi:HK97 family phage major capsid protein
MSGSGTTAEAQGLNQSEVQSNLKAARGRLAELKTVQDTILDDTENKSGEGPATVIEAKHVETFRQNMAEMKELKAQVEDAEVYLGLKAWMDQPAAGERVAVQSQAALQAAHDEQAKSIAQRFVESDEFKSMIASGHSTMSSPFRIEGKGLGEALERKEIYTTLPSGDPAQFGVRQTDPMVLQGRRAVRVRDLFTPRRTMTNVIEYIRLTGFTQISSPDTNNASVVPEWTGSDFGTKPQSELTFTGETATVRTIAHWEAVHRNALADEAQLQGVIEDELLYGLRLHEDYQILRGTGTSQDLNGIQTAAGQSYSWSSGETSPVADTKVDAIRRAMTLTYLAYYEPTGIVVHPSDWEDIELTKTATEGQYIVASSVAVGGVERLWRAPIVQTPAIQSGRAMVGAFGLGATLYDREDSNIRIAEQHGTLFIQNAVLVLAEQRLALAVKRPEAFVDVTFDAAPS